MIDIEIYIRHWLRWNKRSDATEINRIGWKTSGIEYRIMYEAGITQPEELKYNAPNERMAQMVDFSYCAFASCGMHEEMKAMELYFLRKKSIKAAASVMGYSRDKTKRLIFKGIDLLSAAVLIQEMQCEIAHTGTK